MNPKLLRAVQQALEAAGGPPGGRERQGRLSPAGLAVLGAAALLCRASRSPRSSTAAFARGPGPRPPEEALALLLGLGAESGEPLLAALEALRPAPSDILARADGPGFVYQALIEGTEDQSRSGAFYTPPEVAEAMVELSLEGRERYPLLDPACGAGAFALAALDRLAQLGGETPLARLHLIDADPLAARLCGLHLRQRSEELGLPWVEPALLVCADALAPGSPLEGLGAGSWTMVGNPPYGKVDRERLGPGEAKWVGSPPNLAALFTLRCLEKLGPAGRLVFLLPRSLEFVASFRPFRERLLESGTLAALCPIGRTIDVGMEQTVVAIDRGPDPGFTRVLGLQGSRLSERYTVPRERMNEGRALAWALSPLALEILDGMAAEGQRLRELGVRIRRGLPIQRELVERPGQGAIRAVTHREIEPFRFSGMLHLPGKAANLLGERLDRIRCRKVMAQRRVSRALRPVPHLRLKAVYDAGGELACADTVVNLFFDDEELAWAAVAVLNSQLGAYQMLIEGFNGNAETTPDLDRSYLELLYLPRSSAAIEELADLARSFQARPADFDPALLETAVRRALGVSPSLDLFSAIPPARSRPADARP